MERKSAIFPSNFVQTATTNYTQAMPFLHLVVSMITLSPSLCHGYLSSGHEKICIVKLDSRKSEYKQAYDQFMSSWVKNPPPPDPVAIYAISNKTVFDNFKSYVKRQKKNHSDSTTSYNFHGTSLLCNLLQTNKLCSTTECGICGISRLGFSQDLIGTNIPRFMRFGKGFYLAPNSSKCHDYTRGDDEYGVRAQLLCSVASGTKFTTEKNRECLVKPPRDCDSVHGVRGSELNYEEIVVYDGDAVLPEFIIVYNKNGVHQIAK